MLGVVGLTSSAGRFHTDRHFAGCAIRCETAFLQGAYLAWSL